MKVITYLMKVIMSVPYEGYSRNLSHTLNLISTFLYRNQCVHRSKSKHVYDRTVLLYLRLAYLFDISEVLGAIKTKGLNRIAKID
jgi:hypothetical protein